MFTKTKAVLKSISDQAFSKSLDSMAWFAEPLTQLLKKRNAPHYVGCTVLAVVTFPPLTILYPPLFVWYSVKTLINKFNKEVA